MASVGPPRGPDLLLRLFITGNSQRSLRAIEAVQGLCSQYLAGARVEIIDVLENPDRAESEKILATPTLIRQIPGPPRRLVGDLCEPQRVIQLLGLKEHVRSKEA
ncbi:MAG TPA: circadian clock KaiB family protein [Bryobacteraceae bacterium]|jgi:circadian clock protein KaiB|nr:circadian clock KaiB family protein [Bryobacteraceae bacterium]